MIELKRLSPSDGIEIYDLLQSIPREENGLQNKVNRMTYEEYKQWLIRKQVESEQEGIVDGWKVQNISHQRKIEPVYTFFCCCYRCCN